MRTHKLINADGEIYNLTDIDVLFHTTEGYGFEAGHTYYQIGSRYVPIEKKMNQKSVSGQIIFYGESPYVQYLNFTRFIDTESLVLEYSTEAGVFQKDVVVGTLDKGEIDRAGALTVKIEFNSITPWYKKMIMVSKITPNASSKPTFPIHWSHKWPSENEMKIQIESDSSIPSPCKLIIHGPIKQPKWWHYADNEYQSRGFVDYNVKANERLVIDTTSDPYSMNVINNNGDIIDVYQLSDFDMERFIHLKKGMNTITVSSNNLDKVDIELEGYIYYDTV